MPSTIQQTLERATQHHRAGEMREAEELYRRVLASKPEHADALLRLGLLVLQAGRMEEALELTWKAASEHPKSPAAHCALGQVLLTLGRTEDGIAEFKLALELRPDYVEAHNDLGNALQNMGQFDEAAASYKRALELRPDYVEARVNFGNALMMQEKLEEAEGSYGRALALRPDNPVAHNNLASARQAQGRILDAIATYQRALELRPGYVKAHSRLLSALNFHPEINAAAIVREHRAWNERHAEPLRSEIVAHTNDRTLDRPLRVGYVSPDFREHCQSFFTLPLLSSHDTRRFEVYCYAGLMVPDQITRRLRGFANMWRDTGRLPDARVAEMVREDQIDILVDLTMHMTNGRPLLFARKPAPVQVAWLAYPGTTGISAMDYRLTDSQLDPPGQHDDHYTERSVRLPETFWCYDPLTKETVINELPALSAGHVTFGCLNNFCKVSDASVALWGRVMAKVAGSRLILLAPMGSGRDRVIERLRAAGIGAERVEFVMRQPRFGYLQTYHRIDIGLDTVPYNGHTTSLDGFWMGVPIVTRVGERAVGRAGLSQLTNLGLKELAAESDERFVEIAAGLAGDLPRLKQLRGELRGRMQRSPLMDGKRFARNIEAAYRKMWREWCEGGATVGATQ